MNMQARLTAEMETLAKRLKAARQRLDLRQEDVALASGLKQSDISKMENGLILKTTGILALAKALQCDPHWLSTGEGSMTPEKVWPFTPEGIAQFRQLTAEQIESVKEFTEFKLSQPKVLSSSQSVAVDTGGRTSPTVGSEWEVPESKVDPKHEQRSSVKSPNAKRGRS